MWVPHLIEMLFDGLTDFEVIDVAQEINSKFSVAHQLDAPIFHSALIAWKWSTSYSLPDFQITGDTTLPSPLLRLRGSPNSLLNWGAFRGSRPYYDVFVNPCLIDNAPTDR
jgi:hypothetical protein